MQERWQYTNQQKIVREGPCDESLNQMIGKVNVHLHVTCENQILTIYMYLL